MELPLSRLQCVSLDQTLSSPKSSGHFSVSEGPISLEPRVLASLRKWRTPSTAQTTHPVIEESLRRLKPKPVPLRREESVVEEEEISVAEYQNQIRARGSRLCEQIESSVQHGRYGEALDLFEIIVFEGGYEVGNSTYDALVNACIGTRSIRGVKKMINYMFSSRFVLDQYIGNRVLLALVRCEMMNDARKLFDKMPERNVSTWNTMTAGLVDSGKYAEALSLFLELWSESSNADARTLSIVIGACAGQGLVSRGKQLHSCAAKLGCADDIFVSCALIDMYTKCGRLDEARYVFDRMPQKTTVAWNTIISGYNLHGYGEEALSFYYKMRDSGTKMDHFTFSILVRICTRLGSLDHAKQAHAALVRQGLILDVVANTALVDLYSKWGRFDDARRVFDRMPVRNIISWNAMIDGYGKYGHGKVAVELFHQMLKEGMKPTPVTILIVLSACSYSGLSYEGWQIFSSMSLLYKIKPRPMHYACMIELLGKEGNLDEALVLIRDAPFKPTLNMWAALLTACRVHKNLKLGKFALEKLYGMGPEKLSNYVALLNLYNSTGKQEEAAAVFRALREKGLRMVRACTWIEIKKQSHVFHSGTQSHPQAKEIHERLKALLVEISKRGYEAENGRTLLPDVDENEEKLILCHSEKLAVAYGIMSTPELTPLQLVQNHRACNDCHCALKLISEVTGRVIVLRDGSRFHRFKDGSCSCGDYW